MAKVTLEALADRRMYRQENLKGAALERQIQATAKLVGVIRGALVPNKIDRDPDCPKPEKRWDAFFVVPDQDAVMIITSVGDPDESSHNGLFLYIYRHGQAGEDGMVRSEQVVGLQTAKLPSVVDKSEAEWLSRSDPDQLEGLAEMIETAHPITKEAYTSFMEPKRDLSRISLQ